MICPPDVLCRWIKDEERWETMDELAMNIERERGGLPPRVLNSRRMTAAKEAARMETWMKRPPAPVVVPAPQPKPRVRKHVRSASLTLMDKLVEDFRRSLVRSVIEARGGNQTKAAKALGVHRNTISRIVRQSA